MTSISGEHDASLPFLDLCEVEPSDPTHVFKRPKSAVLSTIFAYSWRFVRESIIDDYSDVFAGRMPTALEAMSVIKVRP